MNSGGETVPIEKVSKLTRQLVLNECITIYYYITHYYLYYYSVDKGVKE